MTFQSVRSVFSFFWFVGRKARRTKVFLVISGLPVLMAILIQAQRLLSSGKSVDGLAIFANIIMAFNLQFLILGLALFYGTSICSEELEGKTLTYLTTRPVAKPAIILGKYGSFVARLILMVEAGVVLAFLILGIERLGDADAWLMLIRSMGVLALGLVVYTAFFALVGTILKKSILFGLFFSFGWENIVQYFPGSTQRFTLMHYLKSLLPSMPTGGGDSALSFLMFKLEPSPPAAALAMLLVLTVLFLGLACWIFSRKEYLFED